MAVNLRRALVIGAMVGVACATAGWAVEKDLPYPSGKPDAETIARNVYFVNHVYAVRNLAQKKEGGRSAVVVNQGPDGAVWVSPFERYLNNAYRDGVVKARDLVIFNSGKLRGTGILATVYEDEAKSQDIVLWLPELRKARRVGEPPPEDAWSGSVLTYGDIYLRKPEHETHELLGEESFAECLETMDVGGAEGGRALRHVPAASCEQKGRRIYKVKSTNRLPNGSYDYRIQYVDVQTFADYRSVFYKGDKPVKRVDKAWTSMKLPDPRGQYARYWYGKSLDGGGQTLYAVPDGLTAWNVDLDPALWTESSLSRIQR